MLHSLTSQFGVLLLAGACAVAFGVGGRAERAGAFMVAITWIGLLVAQAVTGDAVPTIPLMVSDAALATGFLLLSIRYGSVWLGAAMLFQAIAFALHSMHLTADFSGNRLYVLSVNIVSACVLVTLAGGALAGWRRRRIEPAQRPAPPPPSALKLN